MPVEDVDRRGCGGAGVCRPCRTHRQDAVGPVGWSAPARRHCTRHGVQAADSALRRSDHRARPDYGHYGQRRNREVARPRRGEFGVVTISLRDAFYVATHMAVRDASGRVRIERASPEKERETEFLMLRDGVIVMFKGTPMRCGVDRPHSNVFFLGRIWNMPRTRSPCMVGAEDRRAHDCGL